MTADSASWRSVATSVSDQVRGSGPKTQSAPITWPSSPRSAGPRGRRRPARSGPAGGRGRARRPARRGRPAARAPAAVTVQSDSSSGTLAPTAPGGRPAPAATTWTSVSSETWRGRRAEQPGREFGQPVQPAACRRRRGRSRRASSSRSGVAAQRCGGRASPRAGCLRGRAVCGLVHRCPSARRHSRCCRGRATVFEPPAPVMSRRVGCAQPTRRRSRRRSDDASGSRDDEGERGAAVMFHVQPRTPQQAPQPHDVRRLAGRGGQQPGDPALVRLVEVADHRAACRPGARSAPPASPRRAPGRARRRSRCADRRRGRRCRPARGRAPASTARAGWAGRAAPTRRRAGRPGSGRRRGPARTARSPTASRRPARARWARVMRGDVEGVVEDAGVAVQRRQGGAGPERGVALDLVVLLRGQPERRAGGGDVVGQLDQRLDELGAHRGQLRGATARRGRAGRPSPPGALVSDGGRRTSTTSVPQLDDHRRVVAGALALALLAVDERPAGPRGQRGRAEDEVDPHALAAGEAQLRVVPVRVDARAGREGPDDVGIARPRRWRGRRPARAGRRGWSARRRPCPRRRRSPVRCSSRRPGRPAPPGRRPASRRRCRGARRASRACRCSAGRSASGRWARRGSTPGRRRRWRRAPGPRSRCWHSARPPPRAAQHG